MSNYPVETNFLIHVHADMDYYFVLIKGLEDSKNKNFGGGDTAWEEKNNLKYKTSELRLTEILETACAKDNFRCNQILSDYEDEIEEWYKTM